MSFQEHSLYKRLEYKVLYKLRLTLYINHKFDLLKSWYPLFDCIDQYVTDWRQYGMNTVLICQADIQEHAINKYRSVEGHVELLINECTLSFYIFAFAIMKSNE